MKKQAFGMIAALFALMLMLLMGAYAADTSAAAPAETDAPANADAAELSAANTAYAILYEDGTLVFQNSATPDGRTVKATYEVDLTASYTYDEDTRSPNTPWYNESESIRVVNFANKVSPVITAYWFYDCSKLERMDNIENLDTANVTDMRSMFDGCSRLTAFDLSHFDTANVTDMRGMFAGCSGLAALDLSHFDTANVTDMRYMFNHCSGLAALDLSHFDTANVIDMGWMFTDCSGLTALDLSHFDTANVTDMNGIFNGCSGLTALNVSHFDTANVTDMCWTFDGCSGLTALDLSHFNTANVTDMRYMFSHCSKLTVLDVSHFDTANVRNMNGMFADCSGLTALDLSHFNTANVRNMYRMFSGCSGLTALDLFHFNTANVTDMCCMFYDCSGLTALDLSHFDSANVSDMCGMFQGCSNLKTIYASNKFVTSSVVEGDYTGSEEMFSDCTALVGGNGTKFDESHTDKEYARIDTASAPGYFTAKTATPLPITYKIIHAETFNGMLSVTLTNPGAATLAVSYFDANGKFMSVELQHVRPDADTVAVALSAGAKTARVTLLDSDCRPLCAAFHKTFV